MISLILCKSLDRPSRYLREAAAAALSEFVRFRYISLLSLCEIHRLYFMSIISDSQFASETDLLHSHLF